jgi:hypothetical protein
VELITNISSGSPDFTQELKAMGVVAGSESMGELDPAEEFVPHKGACAIEALVKVDEGIKEVRILAAAWRGVLEVLLFVHRTKK